jgi:hypothetical protein
MFINVPLCWGVILFRVVSICLIGNVVQVQSIMILFSPLYLYFFNSHKLCVENFVPLFILKQLKDLTQKYPEEKDPDVITRAELVCFLSVLLLLLLL